MIPYVNTLLVAWGRWVVRNQDGGVGWPKCSPMFNDAPVGAVPVGSRPPLGIGWCIDECEQTEQAVQRLNEADRMLLKEVYVIGGTTKAIAERLGWHRQRVPERLDAAGGRLLGHLSDVAAGC
ncbi:antiterminator Q family protein [Zoogloea sp.]|uniref:antiterminator Q family protein n=1 Tax=Zoogloea sp. TaxID=49181 RepID=UPI0035B459E8